LKSACHSDRILLVDPRCNSVYLPGKGGGEGRCGVQGHKAAHLVLLGAQVLYQGIAFFFKVPVAWRGDTPLSWLARGIGWLHPSWFSLPERCFLGNWHNKRSRIFSKMFLDHVNISWSAEFVGFLAMFSLRSFPCHRFSLRGFPCEVFLTRFPLRDFRTIFFSISFFALLKICLYYWWWTWTWCAH